MAIQNGLLFKRVLKEFTRVLREFKLQANIQQRLITLMKLCFTWV